MLAWFEFHFATQLGWLSLHNVLNIILVTNSNLDLIYTTRLNIFILILNFHHWEIKDFHNYTWSLHVFSRIPSGPATFSVHDCYVFFKSKHTLKFLCVSYFVITWLLKRNWAKSVNPVPNDSDFKIDSPNFSIVTLSYIHKLKDFFKNLNTDSFVIFEDIQFFVHVLTLMTSTVEIGNDTNSAHQRGLSWDWAGLSLAIHVSYRFNKSSNLTTT